MINSSLIKILTVIILIIILALLVYSLFNKNKNKNKQTGASFTKKDIKYLKDNYPKIVKAYDKVAYEYNKLENVYDVTNMWVTYGNSYFLKDNPSNYGWKIHISAKPQIYHEIIRDLFDFSKIYKNKYNHELTYKFLNLHYVNYSNYIVPNDEEINNGIIIYLKDLNINVNDRKIQSLISVIKNELKQIHGVPVIKGIGLALCSVLKLSFNLPENNKIDIRDDDSFDIPQDIQKIMDTFGIYNTIKCKCPNKNDWTWSNFIISVINDMDVVITSNLLSRMHLINLMKNNFDDDCLSGHTTYIVNENNAINEQSAKFAAIYPKNDEEARFIADSLHSIFKNKYSELDFVNNKAEFRIYPGIYTRLSSFNGDFEQYMDRYLPLIDDTILEKHVIMHEYKEIDKYQHPFEKLEYKFYNDYMINDKVVPYITLPKNVSKINETVINYLMDQYILNPYELYYGIENELDRKDNSFGFGFGSIKSNKSFGFTNDEFKVSESKGFGFTNDEVKTFTTTPESKPFNFGTTPESKPFNFGTTPETKGFGFTNDEFKTPESKPFNFGTTSENKISSIIKQILLKFLLIIHIYYPSVTLSNFLYDNAKNFMLISKDKDIKVNDYRFRVEEGHSHRKTQEAKAFTLQQSMMVDAYGSSSLRSMHTNANRFEYELPPIYRYDELTLSNKVNKELEKCNNVIRTFEDEIKAINKDNENHKLHNTSTISHYGECSHPNEYLLTLYYELFYTKPICRCIIEQIRKLHCNYAFIEDKNEIQNISEDELICMRDSAFNNIMEYHYKIYNEFKEALESILNDRPNKLSEYILHNNSFLSRANMEKIEDNEKIKSYSRKCLNTVDELIKIFKECVEINNNVLKKYDDYVKIKNEHLEPHEMEKFFNKHTEYVNDVCWDVINYLYKMKDPYPKHIKEFVDKYNEIYYDIRYLNNNFDLMLFELNSRNAIEGKAKYVFGNLMNADEMHEICENYENKCIKQYIRIIHKDEDIIDNINKSMIKYSENVLDKYNELKKLANGNINDQIKFIEKRIESYNNKIKNYETFIEYDKELINYDKLNRNSICEIESNVNNINMFINCMIDKYECYKPWNINIIELNKWEKPNDILTQKKELYLPDTLTKDHSLDKLREQDNICEICYELSLSVSGDKAQIQKLKRILDRHKQEIQLHEKSKEDSNDIFSLIMK